MKEPRHVRGATGGGGILSNVYLTVAAKGCGTGYCYWV